MQRVFKYVRSQDQFAIPVKLTYKGHRQFTTLMGGCCTIMMLLIICSMFAYSSMMHLKLPKFEQSASNSYLSYNNNELNYNMATKE